MNLPIMTLSGKLFVVLNAQSEPALDLGTLQPDKSGVPERSRNGEFINQQRVSTFGFGL